MISLARPADVYKLVDVASRVHPRSFYSHFKVDRQQAAESLRELINSPDGIILTAKHRGSITGLLAGQVLPLWFSRGRYATDLVFVSQFPRDGEKLIDEFEAWAWTRPRCLEVTLAISSGIHPETTGRLYESKGYLRQGGLYTKRRLI